MKRVICIALCFLCFSVSLLFIGCEEEPTPPAAPDTSASPQEIAGSGDNIVDYDSLN